MIMFASTFGTVNGNLVNAGTVRLLSHNLTVNGHLTQLTGRTLGAGTLILAGQDPNLKVTVKVTKVFDPATPENEFYKPKNGNRLVAMKEIQSDRIHPVLVRVVERTERL